eukprot:66821-Rhodomonas_salina.1
MSQRVMAYESVSAMIREAKRWHSCSATAMPNESRTLPAYPGIRASEAASGKTVTPSVVRQRAVVLAVQPVAGQASVE